jgi:beta-lactamase regulating signal transducer with metallopeptidase domain
MNPFHDINTTPLLAILLDATLKGLVLVFLTWCVSRLLGKVSAAGRHTVWTITVVALLALPVLSAALPQWQLPLLPEWAQYKPAEEANEEPMVQADSFSDEKESGETELLPLITDDEFAAGRAGRLPRALDDESSETPLPVLSGDLNEANENTVATNDRAEPSSAGKINWPVWMIGIWLAGSVVVLLPLGLGSCSAVRLVRRAVRVTDESWLAMLGELAGSLRLGRSVQLRRSAAEDIPAVFGLYRPTILIPAGADAWCEKRRRAVLLHELAHVKRRDCLTQLLAQLTCVLYWFNPLAWLVARQLRIERERACDDLVLSAGQRPSEYADHLLEMVRTLRSRACPSLAAVAMAKKSNFEHRLLAILDAARPRKALTKAATTAAFLVAVAVLLPLAMLHVTPKTPEPPNALPEETVTVLQESTTATQPAAQSSVKAQLDIVRRKSFTFNSRARLSVGSEYNIENPTIPYFRHIGYTPSKKPLVIPAERTSWTIHLIGEKHLGELRKLVPELNGKDLPEYPRLWLNRYAVDDDLAEVAKIGKLKSLSLVACDKITDAGMAHVGTMKQLEELQLPSSLMDKGMESVGRLTNLDDLYLHTCRDVTDAGLANVAKLPRLRSILLQDCD